MKYFRLLLVTLLLLTPALAGAEDAIEIPENIPPLPVRAISFRTRETLTYEDLAAPLPLKSGDILTAENLRGAFAALYRREIFDHIDVRLTATPASVDVEFLLTPALLVYDVVFTGNTVLDDKQLRRLAGVRLGERMSLGNLLEAKERILGGHRRTGYFFSDVRVDLEKRPYAPQQIVKFMITEGEPSRITDVILNGTIPAELGELREDVRNRARDAVASEENIKTLRRELLLALRREGYLQASVEIADTVVDRLNGNVILEVNVDAHEPISLVFTGNTVFTAEDLLKPLKLETRTVPFTPSAIITLCREIEKMYQAVGYYFAEAKYAEAVPQSGSRRVYEVRIDEGRSVVLKVIRFEGNAAFSRDELLKVMETRTRGFSLLRPLRKSIVETEAVAADQVALETYYRDRGYLDAKVTLELIPGTGNDTLELLVLVSEGELSRVSGVEIEWKGLAAGADDDALQLLTSETALKEGAPLSIPAIYVEQQRLTEAVIARGFPNTRVEVDVDKENNSVRYKIEPGTRVRIGRIWISGNTAVADRLVKRELEFATGDPFLPDALRNSEQNLYRLGYFRTINIQPTDGTLDQSVEDLTVRVTERDTGFMELGATVNTEDGLHLSGNLGQRNLGGEGQSVVLGVDGFIKTGSELLDAGNIRLLLTRPHFLDSDWEWFTEGFAQYSIELLDPYSFNRLGMSTSLRSADGEALRTTFGYSAFHERLYDVPTDVIIGPDDTGSSIYSFVSLQLDYDRRDNSFNPRSGMRSLLQLRYNPSWLGSSADFFAAFLQESYYIPFEPDLVWANNVRLNYLEPLGDTDVIPLSQRIFLGGRNTLRGFSLNVVGPRGFDGDIVGGDMSLNLNTELQYDLNESLVGVLFVDFGQAWLNDKGTFTGDPLDVDDWRYSPGIGLRYKTPIGPISAELGVNPERENGERLARFFLSVGGAF